LIKEVGARPLTHNLYEMAKRLAQLRAVELPEEALGVQSRFKNITYRPDIQMQD